MKSRCSLAPQRVLAPKATWVNSSFLKNNVCVHWSGISSRLHHTHGGLCAFPRPGFGTEGWILASFILAQNSPSYGPCGACLSALRLCKHRAAEDRAVSLYTAGAVTEGGLGPWDVTKEGCGSGSMLEKNLPAGNTCMSSGTFSWCIHFPGLQ